MKNLLKIVFLLFTCIILFSFQKEERPNILFIEVDDLTAKYLGFFGANFAKTPRIDKLAEEGVVFTNAVVQAAMCSPSRNSLITSLYPHNLGLYHNLDLSNLPKGVWTFPKQLQKEGYRTIWVGKNHLIPNRKGVGGDNPVEYMNNGMRKEMGFHDVFQSKGRSVVLQNAIKQFKEKGCWDENIDAYGDFLFQNNLLEKFIADGFQSPSTLDPETEYMDGFFTTIAIEKLKSYKTSDPFFMWVNFSGPHNPYNAPEKYQRKFNKNDMPSNIESGDDFEELPKEMRAHINDHGKSFDARERKKYSANINYMDEQVGRFIDFINTSRFKDNTIIVFFSDHGTMLGDHGLIGKETLFKEILNPSLIIHYPKKYASKKENTPVELLDLGKTVLAISGAKQETLDKIPNGNSLLPLLKGECTFKGDGIVYSELRTVTSVFNGEFKYLDNEEFPVLFDLKENPDETINVINKYPEIAAYLKKEKDKWLEETTYPKPHIQK